MIAGILCSIKEYGDFEMIVDWKISKEGDNGIYLRDSPQVQIWDTSRVEAGAQAGSGGSYNNQKNPSKPLKVADNPVGEWNYEEVFIQGTRIKVTLNGTVIVDGDIADPRDNGTMDHRDHPGLKNESGHIGFLGHGSVARFRNIRIKDIGI